MKLRDESRIATRVTAVVLRPTERTCLQVSDYSVLVRYAVFKLECPCWSLQSRVLSLVCDGRAAIGGTVLGGDTDQRVLVVKAGHGEPVLNPIISSDPPHITLTGRHAHQAQQPAARPWSQPPPGPRTRSLLRRARACCGASRRCSRYPCRCCPSYPSCVDCCSRWRWRSLPAGSLRSPGLPAASLPCSSRTPPSTAGTARSTRAGTCARPRACMRRDT